MTLTDTQLVLLSAAAQRDDRLLPRPDKLFGAATEKFAGRLIRAGLAEQSAVQTDQPHWSVTPEGERLGLSITAHGLAAIGIQEAAGTPLPSPLPQDTSGSEREHNSGAASVLIERSGPPTRGAQPRSGTKRALLIGLLQREGGASLDALQAATGWQPHTVRAALSGLRKADHAIVRGTHETGRTVYRLTAPSVGRDPAVPGSPAGPLAAADRSDTAAA